MTHIPTFYHRAVRSLLVLVLLGALLPLAAAHAQLTWAPANNGIYGATVSAITPHKDDLLAASGHGIYLLDPSVGSWTLIDSAIVKALVSTPQGTLIGGSETGIYRSTSDGLDWTQVFGRGAENIIVAPNGTIFAENYSEIHRSTDDGVTWLPVATEFIQGHSARPLAVDRNGVLFMARSPFTAWAPRVYRSTDNGDSWSPTGLARPVNAFVFGAGDVVVAATYYGTHRSTDGGATWDSVSSFAPQVLQFTESGALLGSIPQNGYEDTGFGIHRSTDKGATWTRVSPLVAKEMLVLPGGEIWIAAGVDMFHSTNDGLTWTRVVRGMTNTTVRELVTDREGWTYALVSNGFHNTGLFPTEGYSLYRSRDGDEWTRLRSDIAPESPLVVNDAGLFVAKDSVVQTSWGFGTMMRLLHSTDAGASWRTIGSGYRVMAIEANGSGRIAIGFANHIQGGYPGELKQGHTMVSTDGGATWHMTEQSSAVRSAAVTQTGDILIAGYNESDTGPFDPMVKRSTDGGASWETLSDTLLVRSFGVRDDGTVFALASIRGFPSPVRIYRLDDRGAAWTMLHEFEDHTHLETIRFNGRGHIFLTEYDLYRSTDNGATWTRLIETPATTARILLAREDAIFRVDDTGLYASVDNGTTWSRADNGLPLEQGILSSGIGGLTLDSANHVIAGTRRHGVFRSTALSGIASPASSASSTLALDDTGPNPFGDRLTISFHVPRPSHATVAVYDLLGRRVATLVDGPVAAGPGSVELRRGDLSSGTYILSLTTDGESVTRLVIAQ